MITFFEGNETRIVEYHPLRGRKKKHRRNFARGLPVLGVLRHSDNLKLAGMLHVDISEMVPERVFIFEEFLCEVLVYDGDALRGGRVLIGDGTAPSDLGAQSLKVPCADAQP